MDDVICYADKFQTAYNNLKIVFQRLREAGLRLKPKKCRLLSHSTKFLGHVVSGDGVSPDPEKREAVQTWPVPQNVTDLRSFLGFSYYYRKFIPNFSKIACPLIKLTQKGNKFDWTPDCQKAFKDLKRCVTQPPILGYPAVDIPFILDTDAKSQGLGAVLSQMQEGQERVIAYASKTLSKSQKRYCTFYRKLLGLVLFVKHFRHYLWGRRFVVRSDDSALTWLLSFHEPEGMLARWISVLNTYDFFIIHRKGMNHGNADGLSRRSCTNAKCADCGVTLQHGCGHQSLSSKIEAAAFRSLEFGSKPN